MNIPFTEFVYISPWYKIKLVPRKSISFAASSVFYSKQLQYQTFKIIHKNETRL